MSQISTHPSLVIEGTSGCISTNIKKELIKSDGCVEMVIPWQLCRTIGQLLSQALALLKHSQGGILHVRCLPSSIVGAPRRAVGKWWWWMMSSHMQWHRDIIMTSGHITYRGHRSWWRLQSCHVTYDPLPLHIDFIAWRHRMCDDIIHHHHLPAALLGASFRVRPLKVHSMGDKSSD